MMAEAAQTPPVWRASDALPRIVFVFGKGGVGRSTIATALGLVRAARGERVLVLEWAVADAIGPWFGAPPAGAAPSEIAPGVSVANFSLDEALRAYFVDHLHVGLVYRHVIRARPIARLLAVAPGLEEMFFLGQLWWLVTLADREAGLRFDRIVVDAPATGHSTSLLDVPGTLAQMGASGLLALETRRVLELVADPERVGAVVVAVPEPLVVDETLELVPRIGERLGRPPLAVVVNRSAAAIAGATDDPPWLAALAAQVSPPSRHALAAMHRELRASVAVERSLVAQVGCPITVIPEQLATTPIDVVRGVAGALAEAR